jgi:hypothetical protein
MKLSPARLALLVQGIDWRQNCRAAGVIEATICLIFVWFADDLQCAGSLAIL